MNAIEMNMRAWAKNILKKSLKPGVDYNFLRFSAIFGEKIGVFLINHCYEKKFHNWALF
jgi:hypothetical protein